MSVLIRIAIALSIAVLGPRLRGALLTLLSLAALLAIAAFAVTSSSISLVLFALSALPATLAALMLPGALPRIFIALLFALVAPLGPALGAGKIGIAAAVAAFAFILYCAVKKPDLAMRLACASGGAQIARGVFPDGHYFAWWSLGALLLFGIEELLRRFVWAEPAEKPARLALRFYGGAALGAIFLLATLSLPWLVRPLPAGNGGAGDAPQGEESARPDLPPLPFAERRAAIAALAPHGGIIWPLPSEAIAWSEPNLRRELFPYFDNLDALFLGAPAKEISRGFYKLAGTSLLGRLSLRAPISQARLVPDAAAVARLRAAASATVAALHDVLPLIKPGTREDAIEVALLAAMHLHGCGPESFPLIIASGPEAAEPHGTGNLGTLEKGQLAVIDIGCSIDHYASDFTRTLPVSGDFDARQRLLYENVLAAQNAALALCKPGVHLEPDGSGDSLESKARDVLKARAPDHEAHMDHGLGHTVGLFVHDVYLRGPLAAGNVITIEPGTYLPGELGIRIEDTFLVSKTGCDRITEGFPAEPDAIVEAMRKAPVPNQAVHDGAVR